MATEYKLSYTASEIDAKLGQIDDKLDASELNSAIKTALAEAKTSGEFDGADGINGADGYTPIKGSDYWTESDKKEINAYISEQIESKDLSGFEFVDSISDFEDTNKLYILPDGTIYAWAEDYYTPYTNVLPTAKTMTDINVVLKGEDGSAGYLNNYRFVADGTYKSVSGWDVSGCIRANAGDVIRLQNISIQPYSAPIYNSNLGSISFCLEDGSYANSVSLYDTDLTDLTQWGSSLYPKFDESNNIIEFTVPSWGGGNYKYVILTCQDINEESIVTVNEEIVDPVFAFVWSDTGFKLVDSERQNRLEAAESDIYNIEKRLDNVDTKLNSLVNDIEDFSDAWNEELAQGVQSINEAMLSAGYNKSSFLFYSDAHLTSNSLMSPKLLKHLYRNTGMTKTIFGGDAVDNEGDDYTTMRYLWEWHKQLKDLPNHHSVVGNHDDGNGEGEKRFNEQYVYGFLLAPEETPDIVRNDSGLYYYIDSPAEKTRYLYLDTGNLDVNSLSTAQSNFIKSSLKSTPSGWHIVVIAHIWFMPDYDAYYKPESGVTPDSMPIKGLSDTAKSVCEILNNYNNRADEFESCNAKVEFCIGGHVHVDFVGTTKYDTTNNGIPIVIVETDSSHKRNKLTNSESEGTNGSVNGIIANYNTRTLHVVRVGRGDSFTVDLDEPVLITNYTIVNNLTNVTSSSTETSVIAGDMFTTTLTVSLGEIQSVSVTMGGTDITSTAYNANTGVINITKVTGNIIITAIAEEPVPTYTNILDTVGYEVGRLNSTGSFKTDRTDRETTGFIEAPTGTTIYFKNVTTKGSDYGRQVAHYDDSKTFISGKSYIISDSASNATWYDDGSLKSFRITESNVRWVRFCLVDINEDSIISVGNPIE